MHCVITILRPALEGTWCSQWGSPSRSLVGRAREIFIFFLTPGCCLLVAHSWWWMWPHILPRFSLTGTLVCWAETPWIYQTLPTEALAELKLRQGRQQALGLMQVLKPAQPSSSLGEPRPGLRQELPRLCCLWVLTRIGKPCWSVYSKCVSQVSISDSRHVKGFSQLSSANTAIHTCFIV